jgi:hypothetical protein
MALIDPYLPSSIPSVQDIDAGYVGYASPPVAVFDFDGVLCAPDEDFAYRLKDREGEPESLFGPAKHYGITFDLYDTPYLRHLVLQSILADRGLLPRPGPLLELSRQLTLAERPFFVVTARSGRAAIDRALAFLDRFSVRPQEIFFVGRTPKTEQLDRVRRTVCKSTDIIFFDDNEDHYKNALEQALNGVRACHVNWRIRENELQWLHLEAEALLSDALNWFNKRKRHAA